MYIYFLCLCLLCAYVSLFMFNCVAKMCDWCHFINVRPFSWKIRQICQAILSVGNFTRAAGNGTKSLEILADFGKINVARKKILNPYL